MRKLILTCLIILMSFSLIGQRQETWTSFWNKDTTLIGFKDKNGVVKIEPKFKGFTIANKFDDIIAVTEAIDESWNSYYLTKEGRIVGKDSLYIFDNVADCEIEGYIRFQDRKTDKVGMFNKKGDIVIPAMYNDLTKVRNGMIIALKGAEKRQVGEHFRWKGGKEILIDTNNKTIVDNFKFVYNLDFFSVLISSQPSTDSIRQNFKGVNGGYYSFIDFDKEFWKWLKLSLLDNFTKKNLLEATYKEVAFWNEPNGWASDEKSKFIDRNFELIRDKLLQLNSKECDYTIFDEGLNPYIYDSNEFTNYFNNCGESKDWLYPVKNIVISYQNKSDLLQDNFEFLRTDSGYKLISISIRKGVVK